ncbi:phosphate ABC transporter substrate-binding protein PstS [uncultured Demequina sp.]|uniref:phosphate ABC transporter substrate-binding protein PstS n=1 Tax=uncultured Demequina sp. TaxID=693499 RepID=UPI0025F664F3|nr:phosphate ABC transporter substrate-binding protein PstS [uncultured Demequina sp.]
MKIATRTGAVLSAAALTFALAACSPSNEEEPESTETGTETSAEETEDAMMEAWRAGFQGLNADVTVNYDPIGSGGGRTQFTDGATSFAGSDALMDEEEYGLAVEACDGDSGAIHLPLYISPVAVIFNLDGIDSLNMDADTIAGVFNGEITSWDDEAIASQNEGVDLPSSAITIVHRADESGTTENFQDYLVKASSNWPADETSGDWQGAAGESGPGTSALVQIVQDNVGAIGYADASRAGELGTVALKVGEEYVPFSAEAAAAVVDASPLSTGANGENDLAFELDRTTTAAGAYPLVLVSYTIVCQQYDDETERALVTEFVKYVASADGQNQAASAAGSSPISSDLSARVTEILDGIAAG